MSVLNRAALDESSLADLHTIASELAIDGYRRLRRATLIDSIIERQGGEPASAEGNSGRQPASEADGAEPRHRRSRRGARARSTVGDAADTEAETDEAPEATADEAPEPEAEVRAPARRRERASSPERTTRREGGRARAEKIPEEPETEDEPVEGIVELLPNGSGFLRVNPPDPSDDDVYISAAQVKRCELVSGDGITGPRRTPRRSERFASLVRVDTINGRPASEVAEGTRYEDLPAAFPSERFKLGSEDPTVKAIEWLTPFGRGSRVTIVGAPRAGKTEALRRIAACLSEQEDILLQVALAGVRPEEISEWSQGSPPPVAAVSFAASPDAQDHAVDLVIDQARRIAARGAHAVVLIDTLDGLHTHLARKALAAARRLLDGGSLTVIATASQPLGGETTVIALDAALTSTGRFPALDLPASGTLRAELLVGDAGAQAILRARAEALEI
ncbi:MAG: Rho termination factor N-terminal domain-containing protein [Solirubrobacteraceae bacterium]